MAFLSAVDPGFDRERPASPDEHSQDGGVMAVIRQVIDAVSRHRADRDPTTRNRTPCLVMVLMVDQARFPHGAARLRAVGRSGS